MDVLKDTRVCCLWWESNRSSSVIQPGANKLCLIFITMQPVRSAYCSHGSVVLESLGNATALWVGIETQNETRVSHSDNCCRVCSYVA